ncbi:MAG: hypothetical protein GXP27_00125, partial [Planctomycetes bacterium]|nr:hypothetical protein [Planctomycetota bacterium]
MSHTTTRRGFLATTAAASGCLVAQGLRKTLPQVEAAAPRPPRELSAGTVSVAERPGPAANAPVVVVTQSISTDLRVRGRSWIYIIEILKRAGLFFERTTPDQLTALTRNADRIIVLAGDLILTESQRKGLAHLVQNGGTIIGIGGTSGMDAIFGVSSRHPLAEGWMKVKAGEHPITANLRSSLHVFGGYAVKPGSAKVLAELETGRQGAQGSAITVNRSGKGLAILLAPDLIFSIVHIQQGIPVFQDGRPAPDGSAPLDDGELKAEDGLVLHWQRDRVDSAPGSSPVFLEPISDELREIIVRSILYAARAQGRMLPLLWCWPRGRKAIGHISHDTDGNDPNRAVALLEAMNNCGVKSTWCTLYPGGYPQQFYRTLRDQGFEIALHYDARTGGERTSWSKDNFLLQHRWLAKEAELKQITTNKNHYTRWEGRVDFFRWCEELGIRVDETRGPSKKGTAGFPLGGSQPYFPLDDETDRPRFLNVLEINLLMQDMLALQSVDYGKPFVDSVLRHYGVAHFLFHPAHIPKPKVAEALRRLIDYGRSRGLEWWTSQQIYEWEVSRRSTQATFSSPGTLTVRADRPLEGATLLFLQ